MNNLILNNVVSYNNSSAGIYGTELQTPLQKSIIINDTKTYNNGAFGGIYLANSVNASLNNVQSFNNVGGPSNIGGLSLNAVSNATINNSQFYDNTGAGISIKSNNDHLTFNNIQSYNNQYGILADDVSYKDYTTVNNSQIYNNS